jgi:hypothetical protein
MTINTRPLQTEEDWWRVRQLLIETYPLTPVDFNWEIRRWDGQRFHRAQDSLQNAAWRERIRLWETEEGRLVGAAFPEDGGDVHLQLHPDYRHIEADMLAWAEAHLPAPAETGPERELYIPVFDYDEPRQRLLEQRGWEKTQYGWVVRRLRFGNTPLPPVNMAEGYTLRTTRPGDGTDYQRMADVLNGGFNRTIHTADEYRVFCTGSPSFRHDLNLVAEAPDGSFASHVGVTYDEVNQRGIFEPVCTHPAHRRNHLAQTLMFEGLHRLKALGATDVYVGAGDAVAANALYESIGFTEAYRGGIWRKTF